MTAEQEPTPQPTIVVQQAPRPSSHHGAGYWLFIGWWWGPTKWAGRVCLWLIAWPIGLWRSIVHHQDRERRKGG